MLFLWLQFILFYSLMLLLSQVVLHKGIVVGNYGGFVRTTADQQRLSSLMHVLLRSCYCCSRCQMGKNAGWV